MLRSALLFTVVCLFIASAYARLPHTGPTPLQVATIGELRGHLLSHKPDVEQFRLRGPFAVTLEKDRQITLSSGERIAADLFLSAAPGKAPLVIVLHGHDMSKEDHASQGRHLASWGMHALAVQLPNTGPWDDNGKTLARLVALIHRSPEIIDRRIDANRILLAGHSFGGSAVAIALAEGAPAAGGVLLDPAGVGRDMPEYLKRIKKPVIVLGADFELFAARDRDYFFRFIPKAVHEVSIGGARHCDAQFPADPVPGSPATEDMQLTFVSALTSAAFSLSATGNFDYAWASFADLVQGGRFLDARKK
jgi:dienelactone hydrolase